MSRLALTFLVGALFFTTASAGDGDIVSVSVTTKTYRGQFAPSNASMLWVQKPDGTFIKTLSKLAKNYIRYCTMWNRISKGDVDGLSGASRDIHGPITAKWNCTGQDSKPVPDGTYEIWAEMTESNAKGDSNHVTIEIKAGASKVFTGTNTASLTAFSANYQAKATSIESSPIALVSPATMTRTKNILNISMATAAPYTIALVSSSGRLIHQINGNSNQASLNTNGFTPGLYILSITSAGKTTQLSTVLGL